MLPSDDRMHGCVQHHKSKTLDPKWGEFKYCLVQEPKTQNLRVEVHDYDVVNISVRPMQTLR